MSMQVTKVWWDGDKLMAEPVPLESIYKEPEQPAQQEPVAWPCVIAEADFEQDTITLEMKCTNYKVGAGEHWLTTSRPQAREPEQPAQQPLGNSEQLEAQPEQSHCKLCGDSMEGMRLDGAVCGDCAHGIEQPAQQELVPEHECRRLLYGFMLDCNAVGLEQAGKNLHKGVKQAAHGIGEKK